MKFLIQILIPIAFLLSCDPIEIPTPDNTNPVFLASMEIDGKLVQFEIGKLDLVNDPSFNIASNKLLTYQSSFMQEGCNRSCPNSLLFSFNSSTLFRQDNFNFNKSFPRSNRPYNWKYLDNRVNLFLQTKRIDNNKLQLQEQWIQGNITDVKSNQWKGIKNVLTQTSDIKVLDNNLTQLCRVVRIANNNNVLFVSCKDLSSLTRLNGTDSLQVQIKIEKQGSAIKLTAETNGFNDRAGRLEYIWNNDTKSNDKSILLKTVKGRNFVTVYDPILKTKASAQIIFNTDQLDREHLLISSSYNILKSSRNVNPDKNQLGTVSLIYIDANNTYYSSNKYQNPNNSNFIINRIEDYTETGSNEKYKKIEASFNCVLFDSHGERHLVKNGKASFAIKLPK